MTVSDGGANHAALMDGVYRWQRHVYDVTRKYYLLGRDRMIEGLDAIDEGARRSTAPRTPAESER